MTEILFDVAKDTDKAVAIAQVELFPLYKITGLSERRIYEVDIITASRCGWLMV